MYIMFNERWILMQNKLTDHTGWNYFLYVSIGVSLLALIFGFLIVFDGVIFSNSQDGRETSDSHLHQALAQPAGDYPIADAQRMFTNDTAIIKKISLPPYVFDMAQLPKEPVAGQPTLFVFNLLKEAGNVWLWHTDYHIMIKDSKGQPLAVFPNNHGHGSVIQFEYVFPYQGKYTVDVIFGQQQGSPNFMIEPKVIRKANFDVNVVSAPQQTSLANATLSNGSEIKDISMKVESWKFTPSTIEVKRGDHVRLHLTTAQDEVSLYTGHGFGIDGYNVNAFLVKGAEQTIEFIADKPGIHTFRCTSFCSAPEAAMENHFNMVGKLVVH
jgi:heme/copper-type cytochrome/quinol oxidase subunit 2